MDVFKFIKDTFGGLDVLINNAGCVRKGGLVNGKTRDWQEVLDTNVMAICIASREAISLMRDRGDTCQIIHVNSVAGHTVPQVLVGHMNVYPASKFAVRALAETLRLELAAQKENIKVTVSKLRIFVLRQHRFLSSFQLLLWPNSQAPIYDI